MLFWDKQEKNSTRAHDFQIIVDKIEVEKSNQSKQKAPQERKGIRKVGINRKHKLR